MPDSPIEELLSLDGPFDFSPRADRLFFEAMRQSFLHHYDNCSVYRKICYLDGLTPEHFLGRQDIFLIPHMFAPVLKKQVPASISVDEAETFLQLSAPPGESAAAPFDDGTLKGIRQIAEGMVRGSGIAPQGSCTATILPEPHGPVRHIGTHLDALLKEILEEGAAPGNPGPPGGIARSCFIGTVDALRSGPPAGEGCGSLLLVKVSGEGAMDASTAPLEGEEESFVDRPAATGENIRKILYVFGQGIPFVQCREGGFPVPVYCRVGARDPETMEMLPGGERGLLHFYAPHVRSFPAISLLTTLAGSVHQECACGLAAPHFRISSTGWAGSGS